MWSYLELQEALPTHLELVRQVPIVLPNFLHSHLTSAITADTTQDAVLIIGPCDIQKRIRTDMSRAAKLTLAGSSIFALSTIVFVHYAQQAEKAVCLPHPQQLP